MQNYSFTSSFADFRKEKSKETFMEFHCSDNILVLDHGWAKDNRLPKVVQDPRKSRTLQTLLGEKFFKTLEIVSSNAAKGSLQEESYVEEDKIIQMKPVMHGVDITIAIYIHWLTPEFSKEFLFTFVDELTGLNPASCARSILRNTIEDLNNKNQGYYFILLDLNRLKLINDTLGHHMGDRAIAETGKAIRSMIREDDVAVRLGGDEFCLILKVSHPVKNITRMIEERLKLTLEDTLISSSAGAVHSSETSDKTYENLLELADQKMYIHKKQNRSNSRLYV